MERLTAMQGDFYPGDIAVTCGLPWIIIEGSSALRPWVAGPDAVSPRGIYARSPERMARWPYSNRGECWRP